MARKISTPRSSSTMPRSSTSNCEPPTVQPALPRVRRYKKPKATSKRKEKHLAGPSYQPVAKYQPPAISICPPNAQSGDDNQNNRILVGPQTPHQHKLAAMLHAFQPGRDWKQEALESDLAEFEYGEYVAVAVEPEVRESTGNERARGHVRLGDVLKVRELAEDGDEGMMSPGESSDDFQSRSGMNKMGGKTVL